MLWPWPINSLNYLKGSSTNTLPVLMDAFFSWCMNQIRERNMKVKGHYTSICFDLDLWFTVFYTYWVRCQMATSGNQSTGSTEKH